MFHSELRGNSKSIDTSRNNKQNLHTHTTYVDGKDTPEEIILSAIERGFGVLITTDCHDKNFIDCFYAVAEELIRAAGFRTKWILTENGFREVAL